GPRGGKHLLPGCREGIEPEVEQDRERQPRAPRGGDRKPSAPYPGGDRSRSVFQPAPLGRAPEGADRERDEESRRVHLDHDREAELEGRRSVEEGGSRLQSAYEEIREDERQHAER